MALRSGCRGGHAATCAARYSRAMAGEPEVEVRYRCDGCSGAKRVPVDGARYQGAQVMPGQTESCPKCNGTGELGREWVPVAAFASRFVAPS
jgi:hypothetical protein